MADTAEPPRPPRTPPGFRDLLVRADHHMDAIEQAWAGFLLGDEPVGSVLLRLAQLQSVAAAMSVTAVKIADDLSRSPSLSMDQLEKASRAEPPKEGRA